MAGPLLSCGGVSSLSAHQVSEHWAPSRQKLAHCWYTDDAGEQQPDGLQQTTLSLTNVDGTYALSHPGTNALDSSNNRLQAPKHLQQRKATALENCMVATTSEPGDCPYQYFLKLFRSMLHRQGYTEATDWSEMDDAMPPADKMCHGTQANICVHHGHAYAVYLHVHQHSCSCILHPAHLSRG